MTMLDNTQSPTFAGQHPLTLLELEQRASGMACFDPAKKPGVSDCSQSLWISIFFDGTGNNLEADEHKLKHSNIARLYLAHEDDNESNGWHPIYVNGLGTEFTEIGELTKSSTGGAFGVGGERRLKWAREKFHKRLEKAEVRAMNPKHSIRMINVALFGFSRGAALARAFAVRLAAECRQQGEGWLWRGYPIRLYFMGLFDTVASAGLPAGAKAVDHSQAVQFRAAVVNPIGTVALMFTPKNGHYEWGKHLKIPTMVEQCVHYVAAHEVRDSFPLDSVRDGMQYPPNAVEVAYPGVHSDVGGGYAPGEQARALQDDEKLSQIPLLHMHRAAYAAGVPLKEVEMLAVKIRPYFHLSSKTASLFDSYQRKAQAGGPVEKAFSDHLYQLYRARSYLAKLTHDEAAQARIPAAQEVLTRTGNTDKVPNLSKEVARITANGLAVNEAMEAAAYRKRDGKTLSLREATLARAGVDVSLTVAASLSAESDAERRALLDFFDYLVHDSVAGFGMDLSKLENWRMMYFGDLAYEPANNWNLVDASEPEGKVQASA